VFLHQTKRATVLESKHPLRLTHKMSGGDTDLGHPGGESALLPFVVPVAVQVAVEQDQIDVSLEQIHYLPAKNFCSRTSAFIDVP